MPEITRRFSRNGNRRQGRGSFRDSGIPVIWPRRSRTVNGMNTRTLIPPVIPPHPGSPYNNWLNAFPLRSFLELGAYRNAPGSARGHARNVLAEWGLGQFTDPVALGISELITNSMPPTPHATS